MNELAESIFIRSDNPVYLLLEIIPLTNQFHTVHKTLQKTPFMRPNWVIEAGEKMVLVKLMII